MKIAYNLKSVASQTEVTVTQSNLPTKEFYESMDSFVWDFLLGSLKSYLEKIN